MSKQQPNRIEIFRAGTHVAEDGRQLTFSVADVAEIAATYNPEFNEAPLVVGHPKLDAPAYGWAKALHADDKGVLYAEPHQVEPQFAEMTNAGRFKKVSASIYLPTSAGNPLPGKHYLKHIGFLGAAAPGVKGLRSASFAADDDGAVSFSMPINDRRWGFTRAADLLRGLRDYLIESVGLETADRVMPDWGITALREAGQPDAEQAASYAAPIDISTDDTHTDDIRTEDTDVTDKNDKTADFAERENKITADAAALATREKALADREAKAQRDDAVEFAEQLVEDGKLLPRQSAPVVELLLALPADAPVSFAEGDQTISKPGAEVLRELLTAMPKQVDYAEKSRTADTAAVASFAAPQGSVVDAAAAELHAKACAYQAQHPGTSLIAAAKAVGG